MEETVPNPARRRLLAAAVVPELARLLEPLRPKSSSYDDWFAALRTDDVRRMEALLERGFDPNSLEPQLFDTSLIVAIRHKSSNAIALLLSIDNLELDAQSRNGDTALMIASWLSDTKTALALIDRGAEINRPGWTALHYAAASGNVAIIRRLLEESAYIDAESPNGTTPLMMAARGGRREVVQLLLDEGADPLLKNERGLAASDFARANGFTDLARLLDERVAASGRAAPVAVDGATAGLPADGVTGVPGDGTTTVTPAAQIPSVPGGPPGDRPVRLRQAVPAFGVPASSAPAPANGVLPTPSDVPAAPLPAPN